MQKLSEEHIATPEDIRMSFALFFLTLAIGGLMTTVVLKVLA